MSWKKTQKRLNFKCSPLPPCASHQRGISHHHPLHLMGWRWSDFLPATLGVQNTQHTATAPKQNWSLRLPTWPLILRWPGRTPPRCTDRSRIPVRTAAASVPWSQAIAEPFPNSAGNRPLTDSLIWLGTRCTSQKRPRVGVKPASNLSPLPRSPHG